MDKNKASTLTPFKIKGVALSNGDKTIELNIMGEFSIVLNENGEKDPLCESLSIEDAKSGISFEPNLEQYEVIMNLCFAQISEQLKKTQ